MKNKINSIAEVKSKLEKISPSMCLAKWTQSTLYLNSGHTHSCHHPGVHKIPVENLLDNPTQLHNTPFKLEKRKEMLNGLRPTECDYCWRIEDMGKDYVSDRHYKSSTPWSLPFLDQIIQNKEGPNFAPTYLEVSFETTCNFACIYCLPNVSSKIRSEIERFGPYKLKSKTIQEIDQTRNSVKVDLNTTGENAYIDAFWKVLPEWWPTLNTFRITGGEPLLSKHTWSMFEFVDQNANKNLNFAVNSNLSVPDDKIDLFIQHINQVSQKLNMLEVYTSVEATGKDAEYIRYGLNYEKFFININKILNQTDAKLSIMMTINILSYSTFLKCVEEFLILRKKFPDKFKALSFNYLRNPECLDVQNLPVSLKNQFTADLNSLVLREELNHFEKQSLVRLCDYVKIEQANKKTQQEDLLLYLKEVDRRRSLDSQNIFQELYTEIISEQKLFVEC